MTTIQASEGPAYRLVERAARIAGLSTFEPPSLEAVERRRLQLWALASLLLILVAGALSLFAYGLVSGRPASLPSWLLPAVLPYGLLALIALFCAYTIEKELHLRRLTHLLVEEKVLTAALTHRLRELATLLAAGKAINLGLDLDQVLSTIVASAIEILDGRDGSIMLASGGRELRTVATGGQSAAQGARMAFGEGIAGRVAATQEPLLISGRVARAVAHRPSGPPSPASAMSVPLLNRGALLGVLNVNARPGRDYTEHDLRALSLFGEQAASAIANAQLYQVQRLMASQKLFQALHDDLTRLPNRSLFLERVERALGRQRSENQRVALVLLDLDDFKRINDSLGHAAGDEVLIAFAERIRSSVRAGDTVARVGGDEFAVLVEDGRAEVEAPQAAQRFQGLLTQPFLVGDREVRLSGSVGIAIEEPGATGQDELMRNADTALHAAQEKGKGEVVIFERAMHARALRRLHLEAELRRALEDRELVVHYQPICSLSDGRPEGVEALVRWRHPERGLLPAAAFVPFAEHAGILGDIDRWVLREACRVAHGLLDGPRLERPLWVNVNLSPSRLRDSGIVDEVAAAIEDFDLPPGLLTLEITEGAVVRDADRAEELLLRLKELGIRLALDDFGTGYSSLSYIRRFPVDAVKVDRIFIDGLGRDSGTTALVQAIVQLGQGLSLDVIAEGIERRSQVDELLTMNCALGQG
ncbi:MAG TPA: EAL domain-containing protein, partial [Thermoanaerobaculia bacterium]|nr:EAL domain-containing protein [Thermoanaerobaculia bacterium]